MEKNNITVEIAYAAVDTQLLLSVSVPNESTVAEAIEYSKILHAFHEINLKKQKVGIFGRICELEDCVQAGDRIEIYRPLLIDPKEARRKRAKS